PVPASELERQAPPIVQTGAVAKIASAPAEAIGVSVSSTAAFAVATTRRIDEPATSPIRVAEPPPFPSPQVIAAVDRVDTLVGSSSATGIFELSSLIDRLHAPTRWRRNTWLTTW